MATTLALNTVEEGVATEATTAASHESADSSLLGGFGVNGTLFTMQLINFAIVFAIVWYLILKPLTKTMDERKKLIDESLDNAKEVETALRMAEQKYQERIDEAKIEANKIVEAAYGRGEQLSENMRDKARKEIELLISQAKKNIELERGEVREEIKKEFAGLVAASLEKILGEKLAKEIDHKYVEKVAKSIETK